MSAAARTLGLSRFIETILNRNAFYLVGFSPDGRLSPLLRFTLLPRQCRPCCDARHSAFARNLPITAPLVFRIPKASLPGCRGEKSSKTGPQRRNILSQSNAAPLDFRHQFFGAANHGSRMPISLGHQAAVSYPVVEVVRFRHHRCFAAASKTFYGQVLCRIALGGPHPASQILRDFLPAS
jgi:hypothetical protein